MRVDFMLLELKSARMKWKRVKYMKLKGAKMKLVSSLIILSIFFNFSPSLLYASEEYVSGDWSTTPVSIVLNNGSDALSGHKSTVYSVSGAAPVVTNATAPLTITADGTTTIGVTTTDNAGNTSTRSYIIKLDQTAPTEGNFVMKLDNSSGSNYTSGTWTNHNVYVSLTSGSDTASGISSTSYTLTGATTASNQTAATTITAEGVTNVLVTTTDNANNSITRKYEIEIDKTNPTAGTLAMTELASDGSWDSTKKVNIPKIAGTGLIPITLATDGTPTEVTDVSTNWYDYNTTANSSRWANAVTKDSSGNITGYFVWIPRFAYKITSGCNTSTAGTIEIKFLQGTTDLDSTGATISETYPTVTSGAMANFVVHPAFTTNIANGGWDSNISGFWVAKYPAGFQASTVNASGTLQNASDTIVRSNINYSGIDKGYTANAVDSSLSENTKMSYPVFKPLTYAYNCIRIGDSYSLSRDMQSATNFYGLMNVDSHMEKNSEWGAVAYLAQSNYGRNGTEANINNYNMNNTNSKNTYAVTGLYGAGTSDSYVTSINSANAYNTSTGVLGSSTGNITGVYDLNGCIREREASYITNGNSNLATYGSSFAYTTLDATPQTNNRSTKWATAYPYNNSSDTFTNNWTKYSSFKSATYGFGDAILETSISGSSSTSWNGDYSYFPFMSVPFFVRGDAYGGGVEAGAFCFNDTSGYCVVAEGFRVVLIS